MNTNDNDNCSAPPVQLLIPLCEAANDTGGSLTWLHAYCIVTIRPVGGVLQLNGRISLGQRYGDLELIRNLAATLNSGAVLAGHDLTDIISKLGRLSIDANDAKPALSLLAMLKCMLCFHDPIDLTIDSESEAQVAVQQLQLQPGMTDAPGETTHWTADLMAAASGIRASAVRRIWKAHGLQPHRYRQFKLSNDPKFVDKLHDVVGLYVDPPAHAIVLSFDEKSQIQALDRTQPGLPLKKGRLGTMTHDYIRLRSGQASMSRSPVFG
jgi:hypothetical protein